jgi:hypothetical protein
MPTNSRGYRTPDCCHHVTCAYRAALPGLDSVLTTMATRRGYRRGGAVAECAPPLYVLNLVDQSVWRRAA